MGKTGRNELCHCGSGKKYKHCHMKAEGTQRGMNKAFILAGLLLLCLIVGGLGFYYNANSTQAEQGTGFKPGPPPSGEAPAGKVWSYEHGHWHNAP